jgi:HK97 family phage portal protein
MFERRALPTPPDTVNDGSGYGQPGMGWWDTGMVWKPGAAMSTGEAMRLSAVFACLRLLSEAISTLPIDTFRRQGGVRTVYRPRPAYLDFAPPGMSRIDYLSMVMLSLLTDGNAYVGVDRDPLGTIRGLVVFDPAYVTVQLIDGKVTYRVQGQALVPWLELVHIKGMTLPGAIVGLSPIAYARETIGLGLAAQRFGSAFFENGALPSAVIEAPNGMSQEAADRFRETWNARHGGVGQAQRVGVLTEGATLNKVSVQPEDAQFLQTRQFQVPDIARIFGVPPHLIADASNSTSWGSGLAEQNLAFGQFSLRPWIERIEDAHNRLLTTDGLTDVFLKLNLDAMLRASLRDRYDSYAVGITNGFITVDEARRLEDLAPLSGSGAMSDSRNLAEALQKIYLAVGKVISADEAREILNRDGADLIGSSPVQPTPAPTGGATP